MTQAFKSFSKASLVQNITNSAMKGRSRCAVNVTKEEQVQLGLHPTTYTNMVVVFSDI